MGQKYIKLSEYANKNCITYKTAYIHWKDGIISGKQLPTGTILINENNEIQVENCVATYARVSSSENKSNLESQSDSLYPMLTQKDINYLK